MIFDFGGVVHSIGNDKLSDLLAVKTGRDPEELRPKVIPLVLEMSVGKITEDEFWHRLGFRYPEVWREQLADNRLYQPVIEMVNGLKQQGVLTAVLSNTIAPHNRILRSYGWYDSFDRVFLSYEIGLRKPAIEAYKYVLEKIRMPGKECIYVDDLEENLEPAKKLGIKIILAVKPDQVVRDVEKMVEVE